MSINDIISSSTTVSSASVQQEGFGVPLILAQEVPVAFTNRVREYSSLAEMVSDGFLTTKAPYLAASRIFGQSPAPSSVKIGRRALQSTKTIKLKCLSAVVGAKYIFDVVYQGTVSTIEYTVTSGTTTNVATDIAALVDPLAGVGATSATDTVTISSAAGSLFSIRNWWDTDRQNIYLTDTTADPGIATDLAAVALEDDDWYGLTIDSESKAEILAAAAWAEAAKKLFTPQTSESTAADNTVTNDVIASVQTAAYRQTHVIFNNTDTMGFAGAAEQGVSFGGTPVPGKETWALKQLAGVSANKLTSTMRSTILGKNGTTYTRVKGRNVTEGGKVGSGEHVDVIRALAYNDDQVQTRLFRVEVSLPKVPYTQKGVGILASELSSTLVDSEAASIFAPGSTFVVQPKVATASPVDKQNRLLKGLDWGGTLDGAIEMVQVRGFVSV